MKKTLLLALGLGTALAASAASPNYLQEVKSNCAEVNRQKVDMTVHTSAPVAMKVNNVKNVAAVSRIVTKGKAATKCPWYYQVGLFFEGADAEYQSYVMPTFACPPFAEVSYLNASGKATSLWTYGVGDKSEAGGETYTSTDKNLTVSYPMTYSSAPILKVADGQTWQPYGISEKAGNISGLVNSVGVPPSLSVQHFGGNWAPKMTDGRFAFGSNCLVEGVDGFGILFEEPAVPYYVESARMIMKGVSLKNGAELTLNVYKVNDDGTLGDKLAVGKAGADDVKLLSSASGLYGVTFKFFEEDELGGLSEVAIYPETALFYAFTNFKGNSDISFESMCFNWPYVDDKGEIPASYPAEVGYFLVGDKMAPFSALFEDTYSAPVLFVDALMGNLDFDKNSNHFANNGGSLDVAVETNVIMLNGYAENPVQFYAVENDIPDWLEISVSYDATKGTVFNFKADPLPEGVSGRRADVSFTTVIGGREVFVATQGNASVAGVEATNSKVSVVDGNFVVESDNATSVAVYNLAGQKVAEAAFAGKATVPAADLAKGVYVVKFNDNTVVKVAK